MRKYFNVADIPIITTLLSQSHHPGGFPATAFKVSGGGEFTQSMSHHIFSEKNRNELFAIMHGDCMPHHLRKNRCGTRPGANDFFFIPVIHLLNSFKQSFFNIWTFL